jgi:hypothetical protein
VFRVTGLGSGRARLRSWAIVAHRSLGQAAVQPLA